MKKNGFTMVELIAIIIIISVILILSYSSLTKSLKEADVKEKKDFITKIENAAMLYVETNLDSFKRLDNISDYEILIANDLVELGYLDDSIKNPTESSLDEVLIKVQKKEDNTIDYKVYVSGDFNRYDNGYIIYFNPVLGRMCSNYSNQNSSTGIRNGCMKWYVFNDTKESVYVDLILDHNTTSSYNWNNDNSTLLGPSVDFMNKLKQDTVTWIGVERRKDSYNLNNVTVNYNVDYTGYRARIITADEIAKISNFLSYNEKNSTITSFYFGSNSTDTTKRESYNWLYDRTSLTCITNGCANNSDLDTVGYWTITSLPGSSTNALYIASVGSLDNSSVSTTNNIGIRPVITIPKVILE